MSDLISRQAAIKAIDYLPNCYNGYSDTYDKVYIIGVLEDLPTIDPVRHGKWIPVNERAAKCSLCGEWEYTNGRDKTGTAIIHRAIKHYCPNCGARMDGERSEE